MEKIQLPQPQLYIYICIRMGSIVFPSQIAAAQPMLRTCSPSSLNLACPGSPRLTVASESHHKLCRIMVQKLSMFRKDMHILPN